MNEEQVTAEHYSGQEKTVIGGFYKRFLATLDGHNVFSFYPCEVHLIDCTSVGNARQGKRKLNHQELLIKPLC